ncbi:uncharacterized protein A4U43_C09F10300 [Asparagus officinalis]|uniref:Uncharacterized protein n=1 Tax=Asparagus officinalis TaxID=4686 RepID=A0A5P1E729_ASPOF|nr:uncharacterized protein A4U43_C09F10300 [Asparagus officinalis]
MARVYECLSGLERRHQEIHEELVGRVDGLGRQVDGLGAPACRDFEYFEAIFFIPRDDLSSIPCSPPITSNTRATMTMNSFAKGRHEGGPSECDNQCHRESGMVIALSTGWYNGGSRSLNYINTNANGKSVRAKVVDECDSVHGCDADHDFQPPCPNNIVDASPAVWKGLDIPGSQVGDYDITWSDA